MIAYLIVLALVFQPVLRLLLGAHLPRPLAALIIVLALVGLFVGLGLLLSADELRAASAGFFLLEAADIAAYIGTLAR